MSQQTTNTEPPRGSVADSLMVSRPATQFLLGVCVLGAIYFGAAFVYQCFERDPHTGEPLRERHLAWMYMLGGLIRAVGFAVVGRALWRYTRAARTGCANEPDREKLFSELARVWIAIGLFVGAMLIYTAGSLWLFMRDANQVEESKGISERPESGKVDW